MQPPANTVRPPVLLLADDDEDLLLVTRLALLEHGFDVFLSINADHIYELIELHRPDAVLLDVTMNGTSGHDICQHMKANQHFCHVPVLLFSANRDVSEIALSCRADDFIMKPFEMEQLVPKIRQLIDTHNQAI